MSQGFLLARINFIHGKKLNIKFSRLEHCSRSELQPMYNVINHADTRLRCTVNGHTNQSRCEAWSQWLFLLECDLLCPTEWPSFHAGKFFLFFFQFSFCFQFNMVEGGPLNPIGSKVDATLDCNSDGKWAYNGGGTTRVITEVNCVLT